MAESGNLLYHLPITVIVIKLHEASSTVESDTKGISKLHSHATWEARMSISSQLAQILH